MKPYLSLIVDDTVARRTVGGYLSSLRDVSELSPPPKGVGAGILDHPVFGAKALELRALESVAQAFDGDPHGPRWALTVLALAVDGNPKAIAQHGDALEILSAHFSTPAPNDDCPPLGIRRPGGVA